MKRRSVLLGGGALLFGSGATSMAAVNSEVAPTSDLQVLADRKLVVRSIFPSEDGAAGSANRSADANLVDSTPLPQINSTARADLPEANTLNNSNSNFQFNAAFEGNRGGAGTDSMFQDLFVIENLTSSSRDIQISYKNSDQSNSGYGSDTSDTYDSTSTTDTSTNLDPQEAQQIYEFQVGAFDVNCSDGTGSRLSPDGGSDNDSHQGRSVTIDAASQVGVQLRYKTTQNSNLTGTPLYQRVNEVAADNIFAANGAYVDVLDTVWVQDVTP